jgi:alginate O-acetyltransferase complex protein AlgJ
MHWGPFVYTVIRTFEMKMTRIAKEAVQFGYAAVLLLLLTVCGIAADNTTAASHPVVEGKDGWLFFEPELRFLSLPSFWGEAALKTARSPKPENADPLPAIVHFHQQLAERGIALFIMPVPPKAWNTAHTPELPLEGRSTDALGQFYKQLETEGVRVIDLRPDFEAREAAGEGMYCKTDTHWSGAACVAAAKAIATTLSSAGVAISPSPLQARWIQAKVHGDLLELQHAPESTVETLPVRQITSASRAPLQPDPASPILLLGDSHTLVFHDFLAQNAGLPDQIAKETGIVPDWIGTRGSGANAVRISLLRRAVKDPGYLGTKKAVVWCFAAREFTEAEQGWQRLPLSTLPSSK